MSDTAGLLMEGAGHCSNRATNDYSCRSILDGTVWTASYQTTNHSCNATNSSTLGCAMGDGIVLFFWGKASIRQMTKPFAYLATFAIGQAATGGRGRVSDCGQHESICCNAT